MNVYNEIDPYAAAWLRNLSAAGHIAPGVVDGRSIRDLPASAVRDAPQFHAFAGIAGWSYALRLAGWPDDRPVWTGSCPCPSFSVAGKGRGFDDPRHLWPDWFRLIRECRPQWIFGEQVDSPLARAWLDLVHADLEGADYAVGAAVLPAAGVGAPHRRHRIFWGARLVADADGGHPGAEWLQRGGEHGLGAQDGGVARCALRGSGSDGMADASGARRGEGSSDWLREPDGAGPLRGDPGRGSPDDGASVSLAEPPGAGPQGCGPGWSSRSGREGPAAERGSEAVGVAFPDAGRRGSGGLPGDGRLNGFWADAEWLPCRDGKARPTQLGLQPLAHGAPARVGRLRAYGNAIVPQVAAAFVRAFLDACKAGGLIPPCG